MVPFMWNGTMKGIIMRKALSFIGAGVVLFTPAFVSAQLVPCDGPSCNTCHVMTLAQNILNFLVGISAFIGIMVLAYGGFLMLTAAGNASQIERGKNFIWNVLIGLLIVLVAWLIIDTVMKYTNLSSDITEGAGGFGPWNQIQCVEQPQGGSPSGGQSNNNGGNQGGGSQAGGACTPLQSGPCSVSALTPYFGSNASAMSGICNRESRGIPNATPTTDKLWSTGDGFSFGLFQINLVANNISCGGQTLNCPSAFTRMPEYANCAGRSSDPASCRRQMSWGSANAALGFGYTITNRSLYEQCKAAAQDPQCNIQKAQQLYNQRGMQPWYTSHNACRQ
jgi:uncharacterized membrane protein YidH (DUF202 family)